MTRRAHGWWGVAIAAVIAGGCAGGQTLQQADAALAAGNLDQAVAYYRAAAQAEPDNADYQIALQRAMQAASRAHFDKARAAEEQGDLETARREYTLTSEFDPSNRFAADRARDMDRRIRQQIDAARPRPFDDLQMRARAASPVPMLNPGSREPITLVMTASIRDILNGLAMAAGIDVLFDRDVESSLTRQTSIDLQGLTLDQSLNYLMSANQLSFKVVSSRTILVFQDVANKHLQYDDQVIQTFPIAHVDPAQLVGVIAAVLRLQNLAIGPLLQANPATGTIVAKATVPVMEIIAKLIEQNDKPAAEVIIDVEILEVNRQRAKQYGLELSEYAIGGFYSPTGPPAAQIIQPPVNLQTFRDGVSASDFYLAVPSAVVRFLATDEYTKLLAKPQLRGSEGQKMSLRLGEQIPTPSTTFTPIATGAATGNPLTTFAYRDVGVILDITPRVTLDNDIILDVFVDNSAQGGNILVNGISAPTFSTRSVTARLRLRDGESNLIAGLLRDDDRKSVKGFPGAINIPVLKQLFSSNNNSRTQTDIVMLLTPRIIRGKQITEEDLRPIFIGSGQGFGLNGPPPLIAAAEGAPIQTAGGPSPATGSGTTQAGAPAPGVLLVPPPGSSPVPGTVAVPVPSATPVQTPAATQPPPTSAPPQTQTGAAAATPGAGAVPPIADARSSNPPLPRASTASTAGGGAQVTLTPPPSARVGGGPYTVPLTVNDASRLSTVTIVITFDPTRLRARSVQEGSFMRSGGVKTVFSQQASAGRVDIAVTRPADTLGASGSGALGAILFDVLAPGPVTISMSGVATSPGGGLVPLDLRSTSFTIEP